MIRSYILFLSKEVLDKVVPESEIKAFYDKDKDRLLIPEQIKVHQTSFHRRQIRNQKPKAMMRKQKAKQNKK